MDILNKKSGEITSFLTALDDMLSLISRVLSKRTPALNGEKYLTNRDVCKVFHMSLRTLQELRDSGKIPYIQITGKILYQQSDILKLLEDNYYKAFQQ